MYKHRKWITNIRQDQIFQKVWLLIFHENEARQNGSATNGKQTERMKSEKVKAGYT